MTEKVDGFSYALDRWLSKGSQEPKRKTKMRICYKCQTEIEEGKEFWDEGKCFCSYRHMSEYSLWCDEQRRKKAWRHSKGACLFP